MSSSLFFRRLKARRLLSSSHCLWPLANPICFVLLILCFLFASLSPTWPEYCKNQITQLVLEQISNKWPAYLLHVKIIDFLRQWYLVLPLVLKSKACVLRLCLFSAFLNAKLARAAACIGLIFDVWNFICGCKFLWLVATELDMLHAAALAHLELESVQIDALVLLNNRTTMWWLLLCTTIHRNVIAAKVLENVKCVYDWRPQRLEIRLDVLVWLVSLLDVNLSAFDLLTDLGERFFARCCLWMIEFVINKDICSLNCIFVSAICAEATLMRIGRTDLSSNCPRWGVLLILEHWDRWSLIVRLLCISTALSLIAHHNLIPINHTRRL